MYGRISAGVSKILAENRSQALQHITQESFFAAVHRVPTASSIEDRSSKERARPFQSRRIQVNLFEAEPTSALYFASSLASDNSTSGQVRRNSALNADV